MQRNSFCATGGRPHHNEIGILTLPMRNNMPYKQQRESFLICLILSDGMREKWSSSILYLLLWVLHFFPVPQLISSIRAKSERGLNSNWHEHEKHNSDCESSNEHPNNSILISFRKNVAHSSSRFEVGTNHISRNISSGIHSRRRLTQSEILPTHEISI